MSNDKEILLAGQNVSRTYHGGTRSVRVLDQADFTFTRGSFTAIIGRSGSGKTTLLNLCGGLDRLDSGTILFENQHLEGMTERQLAEFRNRHVGFVFQSFFLREERTALENVMVPLLLGDNSVTESRARAEKALIDVGLKDKIREKSGMLSGGQKQRVAIARAIANQPAMILADEPTGSLDTETSREILGLLQKYNREHGTTVIVVTHDPLVEQLGVPMITIVDGKVQPAGRETHPGGPEVNSSLSAPPSTPTL